MLRLLLHTCPLRTVRARRAPRSHDPSDHELARPRLGDDRAPADPEVEHAPQLVLGDVAREPREHGRALPGAPVELDRVAVRDDAREVAEYPAAGHVRE